MSKDYSAARSLSSSATEAALVLKQGNQNQRIRIKKLRATGANAGASIDVCVARKKLETTVKTAAAAAATSIVLNGDDDGYINGYQIADTDYLLVATASGFRLLSLSAAVEDAGNDQVTLTVAGLDGITGVEAAVAAGAKAYILRADEFVTYGVGSASIEKDYAASGDAGLPIALKMQPGASTDHDFNAYVEVY